jgi:hypothetical protein
VYSVRTLIYTISHQILHRISSIVRVIKKDLGAYPEDLFLNFEEKPIASGSRLSIIDISHTGRTEPLECVHSVLLLHDFSNTNCFLSVLIASILAVENNNFYLLA